MRNNAIDISKGLAIILMVLGHALPQHHLLRMWIYSFHMPLFFMLAGMTFHQTSYSSLIRKSTKRLLIPFAICLLFCIAVDAIFGNLPRVIGRSLGFIFPDSNRQLTELISINMEAGSLWFLPALFWSRLGSNFVSSRFPKSYPLVGITITVVCGYLGKYYFNLPFAMLVGMCGMGFMLLGAYIRNIQVPKNLWIFVVAILFVPIWVYASNRWHYEMFGFNYLKRAYPLTLCLAACASVFVYCSMQIYDNWVSTRESPSVIHKALTWCGKNSLYILVCHQIITELLWSISYKYILILPPIWKFMYICIGSFLLSILFITLISNDSIRSKIHLLFTTLKGKNRVFNQRHCYDYPAVNNEWEKYSTAPVLEDANIGVVFDPFVMKHDGKFLMAYSNRSHNSIDTTLSTDGIHWINHQTILNCIPDTWEDIVNRGSIVYHQGLWMLWYTGQHDGKSAIGLATSKDGKHYTRFTSNPILSPELSQEGVSVMNPHVIWNEQKGKFQMWYSAGENYEPDVIFYAESADGVNWKKRTTPVLKKNIFHRWEKYKVGGCHVEVLSNHTYIMYYIGYQNIDVARICFATSDDGIHWHRSKNNLLLSPSKGSWDSDACYKPTIVRQNNKLYLWYNGRKGIEEYIGLATKEIAL